MSKKSIIIIGILIVLSFFAYIIFFKDKVTESEDGLTQKTATTTSAEKQIGAEILAALAALEKLKGMDVAFFNQTIFDNLKRSDQQVPSVPLGRRNPFAPIGSN